MEQPADAFSWKIEETNGAGEWLNWKPKQREEPVHGSDGKMEQSDQSANVSNGRIGNLDAPSDAFNGVIGQRDRPSDRSSRTIALSRRPKFCSTGKPIDFDRPAGSYREVFEQEETERAEDFRDGWSALRLLEEWEAVGLGTPAERSETD